MTYSDLYIASWLTYSNIPKCVHTICEGIYIASYLCFLRATVNTTNAMATDMKIAVAAIVKINKVAGTHGWSTRPSAVGGSIKMNTGTVNSVH